MKITKSQLRRIIKEELYLFENDGYSCLQPDNLDGWQSRLARLDHLMAEAADKLSEIASGNPMWGGRLIVSAALWHSYFDNAMRKQEEEPSGAPGSHIVDWAKGHINDDTSVNWKLALSQYAYFEPEIRDIINCILKQEGQESI